MMFPEVRSSKHKKLKSRRQKSKTQTNPLSRWHPRLLQLVDWMVSVGSVILCLMMLLTRFPGMELLGIAPNWLLIWVVAWSVKRTAFQGVLAGVVLGLLQDAMTSPNPSHAVSLGIVGFVTGSLQKQRFIQEDFISIALIVFCMAVLAETIFGVQMSIIYQRYVGDIWVSYQKLALASAILSSLWAPVLYFPLNHWWQQVRLAEQS
jgi:rod shape-determining protein MreD